MVTRVATLAPLVALRFSPAAIAVMLAMFGWQSYLVHANVRVTYGPLRWVLVSPEFHHWHHSSDPAHHDRNFAGQCPIVDWLFGTLHMPAGQWPVAYGLAPDAVPVPPQRRRARHCRSC